MGYIYGIKNRVNSKWYIGQSIYHPKERWRVEIAGYPQHNMVISKAINKYGVENFDFIILEKVKNNLLDEREKYWISQKDSYMNGYNATRGGTRAELGYRIKYSLQEIVDYYTAHKTLSCRDVAQHFGIFHETVSAILKEFNIPLRRGKHPITLKRKDEIYEFSGYGEAADFLIANNEVKQKRDQLRKNILPYKDYIGDFEIIRG